MQPISYHCFVSYTTREEEVRVVQPFVDAFLLGLRHCQLMTAPFFYDHLTLAARRYRPEELREALIRGVRESICMVAFVSDGYLSSPWCLFEWAMMDAVQLYRGPNFSAILPIEWKELENRSFVDTRPSLKVRSYEKSWWHSRPQWGLTDLCDCILQTIDFVERRSDELRECEDVDFDRSLRKTFDRGPVLDSNIRNELSRHLTGNVLYRTE